MWNYDPKREKLWFKYNETTIAFHETKISDHWSDIVYGTKKTRSSICKKRREKGEKLC